MKATPKLLLAVFLGGAIGSVLRFGIGVFIPSIYSLVFVNLAGAAFLGFVNGRGSRGFGLFSTHVSRGFWGAGFAGGFTTMSGLAQVFALQVLAGQLLVAAAYIAAQFFLGVAVYVLAFKLAGRVHQAPLEDGSL